MQQRRLRPGDVLDDYCPRERRVTDHAIVAMIDDTIQQTRCVVCDAEHEYKQAKVPPQRKKKAPALFTQVLDGLKAPTRAPTPGSRAWEAGPQPQLPDVALDAAEINPEDDGEVDEMAGVAPVAAVPVPPPPVAAARAQSDEVAIPVPVAAKAGDESEPPQETTDAPLFRRRLIRAALPRPEGTPPPTRVIPEFTMRQPLGRNRPAGRRRRGGGQHQGQGGNGPARFGREGQGQRSNGHGRPGGHGGRGGHGGHGGPNGNRSGRRGGKKR